LTKSSTAGGLGTRILVDTRQAEMVLGIDVRRSSVGAQLLSSADSQVVSDKEGYYEILGDFGSAHTGSL